MVEQMRAQRGMTSPQAGPGDPAAASNWSLRMDAGSARACGRRLAAIGDHLDREWASRRANGPPSHVRALRRAQAAMMTFYRDIHPHLGGVQGLSVALKAWIVSSVPGLGLHGSEERPARVSSFRAGTLPDWVAGLLAAALAAAVSVFCAPQLRRRA